MSGDHGESFWCILVSWGVILGLCHEIGKFRRPPDVLEPCDSGRATAAKSNVSWHGSIHERRLVAMRDHWYQLKIEKHGQNGCQWGKCVQSPPEGKPPPGAKENASHHVKNTHHTHSLTHGMSLARAALTDFGLLERIFGLLMVNFLLFFKNPGNTIPALCKNVLGVSGDHGESFWCILVFLGVNMGPCHEIGKIRRPPNVLEPCGPGRARAAKSRCAMAWFNS